MVVCGHVNASSPDILDRLISATVPEVEHEGVSAERTGNKLVPQANSERWYRVRTVASEMRQITDGVNRPVQDRRITWSGRQRRSRPD